MNAKFLTIRNIYEDAHISQREIARRLSLSLGKVNQVIKEAERDDYLLQNGTDYVVTKKGMMLLNEHKVDAALILACGMGVRLAPFTYDTPKSFIKIKGERMIERQIEQLHASGITDITIMVGYLKERFDYLVDKYGVKLIYNPEYKEKNTLSTFYHALDFIRDKNIYICVSDVYIAENIYHRYEVEPYYIGAFYDDCKGEWRYLTNSKNEIKGVELGGTNDYCLVGPCFLTKEFLSEFIPMIKKYYAMTSTDNYYWEDVLVKNFDKLPTIYVYKLDKGIIFEFDTINDIKKYDSENEHLGSEAIDFVTRALSVKESELSDIECVKEGMTNHSYKFKLNGTSYIARVPGEGTEEFIDRKNEYEVYELLKDSDITEEVVFFDKNTGYKISKYFEGSHIVDITNENELIDCMKLYKKLHSLGVQVETSCDIIDKIDEYMGIIKSKNINVPYEDFEEVLIHADVLIKETKGIKRPKVLCHGDPNPGNVLYTSDGLRMIDFEYAGMADPLSEIALFGDYVGFDIEKTLKLYEYYSRTGRDPRSFVADARAAMADKEPTGLPVHSRDPRAFVADARAPQSRTGRDPRSFVADARAAMADKEPTGLPVHSRDPRAFVADARAPQSRTGRPVGDNMVDIAPDKELDIERRLIVIYMALGGLYSAIWAIVREALGGSDYGAYGMKNYRTFKTCYQYLQK